MTTQSEKQNILKWFHDLSITARIKIAEWYTLQTGDNTDISQGLTVEAEKWLLNKLS